MACHGKFAKSLLRQSQWQVCSIRFSWYFCSVLKQKHMVVTYFPWYCTRRPPWKPRPWRGGGFRARSPSKISWKYVTANVVLFLCHALNLKCLISNNSEKQQQNTHFISRLTTNLLEDLSIIHVYKDTDDNVRNRRSRSQLAYTTHIIGVLLSIGISLLSKFNSRYHE